MNVIKNSLSFCFSLSFPYYLPAELWIVILEVWRFIIRQVNNNATLLHCQIKNQPFSHKKSVKLWIGSICTRNCCRIKNHQTSECCRFVIRQITQWRIQDFPKGGVPTPQSASIFQIFCWKLHENERIWTPGGTHPWHPPTPLDPPMLLKQKQSSSPVLKFGWIHWIWWNYLGHHNRPSQKVQVLTGYANQMISGPTQQHRFRCTF